ncbi:sulfotransferase family 2 domain-containing protein [Aestuariicoccus sp. MJ-SS9]|uniref:sulfotransferase family 2 domain-containing protein n=1 Tax=Aestuariicoccus sp. MJ-SS9 TaxID=3079855 RepID=UPI0029138D3A|nr:sulfotransferase family 2 domain-containing protein [Aestuariicoccus sp. MJ-SS9]MDU8913113.1 sulfotransferase family 2 domain-containing protein [Aestuariicoccus sp. MJ-SS9]
MVIAIDAHKIAYMAVPKAGCSSVKRALAHIDPSVTLPPEAERDVYTWHAIYPTKRFRPQRWQAFEDDDWFRFTVVRDPVRRLMSCYVNRVVELKELHNCRKILRGRVDLPKDPDPDFFFQNLKAYREASSSIKHHALGSWLFTGPDLTRYSRVYKVEEMDELARKLTEISGQPVEMPRENKSSFKLTLDDLKPRTFAAILPHLDREYAHLSGYYDNPL